MAEEMTSKRRPLLSAEIEESGAASPGNIGVARGDAQGDTQGDTVSDAANNDEAGCQEKKRGHKFFFFCCDTKRAVIWLNTVILLLNIFTFTAAAVQLSPEMEGYMQAMLTRGCGMFVTFTTLIGAYSYSKSIVFVGLLFACYQLTMGIIQLSSYNWGGGNNKDGKLEILFPVVWYSLLLYSEAVFILEVHRGTMSAETYKRREKYSCCCNC